MVCNAWTYCGASGGCHNITADIGATKNACSLYYASDLDYNVPLDKNVGVTRATNVTFTSGVNAIYLRKPWHTGRKSSDAFSGFCSMQHGACG